MAEVPAVRTVDVTKVYQVGHVDYEALRGVSFEVSKGELVSIIGPSGSGKSTLLNIIGALDKPTRGRVYIDGVDLRKLDEDRLALLRNRKIGFVYQSFNLIQRLTAEENVEMPLIARGVDEKERKRRARRLLEAMGLGRMMRKRPIELSGGEQQRIAIARALVIQPSLVIADEPTGNLDSKTTAELLRVIVQVNKSNGTTFVIVTHNPEVAEKTNRIVFLKDGLIEKEQQLERMESYMG